MLDTGICLCYNIACGQSADGEWCNGSTYDSDSYCLGSNPSSPALFLAPLSRGLGRGPLKAETRVRIPSELLFYVLANEWLQGFFISKNALYTPAIPQLAFLSSQQVGNALQLDRNFAVIAAGESSALRLFCLFRTARDNRWYMDRFFYEGGC